MTAALAERPAHSVVDGELGDPLGQRRAGTVADQRDPGRVRPELGGMIGSPRRCGVCLDGVRRRDGEHHGTDAGDDLVDQVVGQVDAAGEQHHEGGDGRFGTRRGPVHPCPARRGAPERDVGDPACTGVGSVGGRHGTTLAPAPRCRERPIMHGRSAPVA